jgi:hypothetical protein
MENLVHYTERDWKEIALKAQGKDAAKPDVSYQFSNGRKFETTDNSNHGIYED